MLAVVVLTTWGVRSWRARPVSDQYEDGDSPLAVRAAAASAVVAVAAVGSVRGVGPAYGADEMMFYGVVGAGSWGGAALVTVAALWTIVGRRHIDG